MTLNTAKGSGLLLLETRPFATVLGVSLRAAEEVEIAENLRHFNTKVEGQGRIFTEVACEFGVRNAMAVIIMRAIHQCRRYKFEN